MRIPFFSISPSCKGSLQRFTSTIVNNLDHVSLGPECVLDHRASSGPIESANAAVETGLGSTRIRYFRRNCSGPRPGSFFLVRGCGLDIQKPQPATEVFGCSCNAGTSSVPQSRSRSGTLGGQISEATAPIVPSHSEGAGHKMCLRVRLSV